ncbi:MAG: response regulator transcription factor [Bacteroidetes bacterium]|nr:response regulator transcription factor [Bacteroidota bacterium]
MEHLQKILLVDDEQDILDFLSYNLEKEGFSVRTSTNGKDAIKEAARWLPDLILLDVMMPGIDGMETCQEIRKIDSLKNVIIAFLTARSEDYSQISGFDVGADDYITKPIKPRVLISRIKALLRRTNNPQQEQNQVIELGSIRIEKDRHIISQNGIELFLPKKEFKLFFLLASKPGKVFSREYILQHVWGNDVVVGDRTIDVHIRKLREKLGEEYIKTIKGVGYKFDF